MYAFDATWSQARHHTHRATRASLSFAGQRHYVVSVLGVFHVICFVCQFGFANALLFYSASVMNQTLVVNELTRVPGHRLPQHGIGLYPQIIVVKMWR